MKCSLVSALLLVTFFGFTRGASDPPFLKLHREPLPKTTTKVRFVEQDWMEQFLDHFDPANDTKWRMRYLQNGEFYQSGGPIFIYVGGEWDVSPIRLNEGHMYDMAKEFRGFLFYTEHRFYGASRPTPDLSVESLRFLTVDQALADLAHFIQNKTHTIPDALNSPVFLVGASYAGSVVTWFSHKYPQMIAGAWASSAPLEAVTDFQAYYEVAAESIKLVGGQKCIDKLQKAYEEMEKLYDSGNLTYLSQKLTTCEPLTDDRKDRMYFFARTTEDIANVVQNDAPEGIDEMCKILDAEKDPLTAFANFLMHVNPSCSSSIFESGFQSLANTQWSPYNDANMRQWVYQLCNEVAWFQTSNSPNQPFSNFPLEYYTTVCQHLFGSDFTLARIEHSVCEHNAKFGGLKPQVKNVYSTHGQLDPWRVAGAPENINADSPTTIIPLHSHCSDLESISDQDHPSLSAAKERIRSFIKNWGDL
ncbi:thymus-specific serine protease-like [Phlebotomus argentipes]|uniref:thymus-specific serine protease-like n=1 Tax=Phlebotomus argentipes TaxID=94469 RepID=UPI002892D588|nr:thymus-specific serine protease-like [Phlebotomus argentipes]